MKTDKECRYFVKLDIRHFFESIDRDKLMDTLRRKIKAPAFYVGGFAMAFFNTAFFMGMLTLCFWKAIIAVLVLSM